jgi:hypothetical protein
MNCCRCGRRARASWCERRQIAPRVLFLYGRHSLVSASICACGSVRNCRQDEQGCVELFQSHALPSLTMCNKNSIGSESGQAKRSNPHAVRVPGAQMLVEPNQFVRGRPVFCERGQGRTRFGTPIEAIIKAGENRKTHQIR